MHLIDVEAVLNIVDGHTPTDASGTCVLRHFRVYGDQSLRSLQYAILSHCWQEDEVDFEAVNTLTRDTLQNHHSGTKVIHSCREARRQGLKWLWIDSCCIDEVERQKAINSMYQWYRCSKVCFAYLHDVADVFPQKVNNKTKWPRWLFRGWTLQELIAPAELVFFNQKWEGIGDRTSLAATLNNITRIPEILLQDNGPRPIQRELTDTFSVAQIMSWAADRETREPEDRAYSLAGLFGVFLEVKYGEGASDAFQRLQEVLIKEYEDQSIFSWSTLPKTGSVLAESPSDFRDCADVIRRDLHSLAQRSRSTLCQGSVKIPLRVTRCLGSSYIFRAELACCHRGNTQPITITLAESNEVYHRIFESESFHLSNEIEEREIYLWCRPVHPSAFTFDISNLPKSIILGNDLLQRDSEDRTMQLTSSQHQTIRYRHIASGTSHTQHIKGTFGIFFGFCIGRGSVHVDRDGPSKEITSDVVHHANCIRHTQKEVAAREALEESKVKLIRHFHIPHTLQAVELVYENRGWKVGVVTLKVVRCVGYCVPIWVSVDGDYRNQIGDEIAQCFKGIKESYFGFVCISEIPWNCMCLLSLPNFCYIFLSGT